MKTDNFSKCPVQSTFPFYSTIPIWMKLEAWPAGRGQTWSFSPDPWRYYIHYPTNIERFSFLRNVTVKTEHTDGNVSLYFCISFLHSVEMFRYTFVSLSCIVWKCFAILLSFSCIVRKCRVQENTIRCQHGNISLLFPS